jgi:hypothetical protein
VQLARPDGTVSHSAADYSDGDHVPFEPALDLVEGSPTHDERFDDEMLGVVGRRHQLEVPGATSVSYG